MAQDTLMKEEKKALNASPEMISYFERFRKDTSDAYIIAQRARARGYDPEDEVSVALAKTLGERVIGLISVAVPSIKNAGVERRIEELEEEYGALDWRVSFKIALEIAQQKFCKFESDIEAITAGIRVGFAYITLGVVSAPLEGLTGIELKDRMDKKGKYFCLNFSGPIRNAGGTAASVCVLIADYVRSQMGFAAYDPTEKEISRCFAEISDYHEWITNLQYFPSEEESRFLMRNLPVEIGGDPSERYEVANVNLKDLPRIPTNNLRSGYCLIHSSCIPLKAPKIWKQLSKWGADFGMTHWTFLQDFVRLQKQAKAGSQEQVTSRLSPDYTYIKDLVAGRPVLAYPLRPGGFRLRYGRSRSSGYSGQAIHPSTMHVLNNYIASATQLKVERPGKAAVFMPCDTIEGPIVKLADGSVVHLQTEEQALNLKAKVAEILYLGDVLINYGDFYDRNHNLVPAGYCPEWWIQEVERSLPDFDIQTFSRATGVEEARCKLFIEDPLRHFPTAKEAIMIATKTSTPLHSAWTPFWKLVSLTELRQLADAVQKDDIGADVKPTLETLGIPHTASGIVSPEWKMILQSTLREGEIPNSGETVAVVNALAAYTVRDKAGTFIGARMGRPEKAKMRKLTGSPHCLFPVGNEGGRLRSVQETLRRGRITAEFPLRYCQNCQHESVFGRCEVCDRRTEQREQQVQHYSGEVRVVTSTQQSLPIGRTFEACLKKLGFRIYPDLIKGVRGTSNQSHIPEHLIKGILRARNDIYVNKDGTTRYDSSEVALTHFSAQEAGVSVATLVKLGYSHDCKGATLEHEDQLVELKPQDVLLPCCPESPDERADDVLLRVANFVDEELSLLYGQDPYYNLKSKEELVGHYIVGLAPHTSAGIVGRIVGFSQTQGFLAHPLFHAAMRRDCDGDESCILLLMDVLLNFSAKFLPESRGSTMDAPLVITYCLNPSEVDDMAFHVDRTWRYPLELYEAALQHKKPYDVKVDLILNHLHTPQQFEGMGFTHGTSSINAGVLCSAYKILPSMDEKLAGQMDLAQKIRACDVSDVARLVIEKHFIRDIKGNFRKFSQQEFRCVSCNTKYRRPPLMGRCLRCRGNLLFTISEGSIVKYLERSIELAATYEVPPYLRHDLDILKRRIEDVFGREKEKQTGLGEFA